jgi:signal transduction histidine kinase
MADVLRDNLEAVFSSGKARTYEVIAAGPHGTQAWYQSRIGPVIRDGQIEAAIIIATDVTSRKQAEQELRQEQRLLKELLRQQEFDRQLVAYEIHDGLVQYVTGALMRLEALGDSVDMPAEQIEDNLLPAIDMLRTSIREGRRLISGLRPPILDEEGIIAAIDYLIGELADDRLRIAFRHEVHAARFSPLAESALFRICQEALTNARKHSQSELVEVLLVQEGDLAQLEIRDHGVGFDPASATPKSFGLQGIRERARLMGGQARIASAPGKGTSVSVEIPIGLAF